MKIGYACVNTSIGCTSSKTFRLKNYSEKRFVQTVKKNLKCLKKILRYNNEHEIMFYRISSKIIPFASHPVCKFGWTNYFKKELKNIGEYIKKKGMRVSMHPDPFIVLNSKHERVVRRSVSELIYHAELFNSLGLDEYNKIVIHVGGVYNNKEKSTKRFIKNYEELPEKVRKYLVVENDEKSYTVKDCLNLNIPVIVDNLHHELNNNDESLTEVVQKASNTWKKSDGPNILHYSEQRENSKKGRHSKTISIKKFRKFYETIRKIGCDVMIESKDKEQSALKAIKTFY